MGHESVQITFDRSGRLRPGNEADAASLLHRDLSDADGYPASELALPSKW
jgi:hypothetical protein